MMVLAIDFLIDFYVMHLFDDFKLKSETDKLLIRTNGLTCK